MRGPRCTLGCVVQSSSAQAPWCKWVKSPDSAGSVVTRMGTGRLGAAAAAAAARAEEPCAPGGVSLPRASVVCACWLAGNASEGGMAGTSEASSEARTRLSELARTDPEAMSESKSKAGSDFTVPAAVDLRSRDDYAGPPSPELAPSVTPRSYLHRTISATGFSASHSKRSEESRSLLNFAAKPLGLPRAQLGLCLAHRSQSMQTLRPPANLTAWSLAIGSIAPLRMTLRR